MEVLLLCLPTTGPAGARRTGRAECDAALRRVGVSGGGGAGATHPAAAGGWSTPGAAEAGGGGRAAAAGGGGLPAEAPAQLGGPPALGRAPCLLGASAAALPRAGAVQVPVVLQNRHHERHDDVDGRERRGQTRTRTAQARAGKFRAIAIGERLED